MNRFAALLDALLFTPSRNGKLRLMREYFAAAPDPERGWALAALTGELVFDEAKPSQVRALAAARVDPELLGWSYDFVGDLAETVSLIWPAAPGGEGHVPSLSEIVEQLKGASRSEVPALLEPWLDALDATGRWALLKLVTRELRIGVSARLAKTALAKWSRVELDPIEEICHGLAPPYQPLFDWLEGRRPPPEIGNLPTFTPLMLAQPLEDADIAGLDPHDYLAEWKWDGIRVQLVARGRRYRRRLSGHLRGNARRCDIGRRAAGDPERRGRAVQRSAAAAKPQDSDPEIAARFSSRGAALRHPPRGAGRPARPVFCRPPASSRSVVCARAAHGPRSVANGAVHQLGRARGIARRRPPARHRRADAEAGGFHLRLRPAEGPVVQMETRRANPRHRADVRPARPRQALLVLFRLHLRRLARRRAGAGRQGLLRFHRRGIAPPRPVGPQQHHQALGAGARGEPADRPRSRLRQRPPLDPPQIRCRDAFPAHPPHPLGQTLPRSRHIGDPRTNDDVTDRRIRFALGSRGHTLRAAKSMRGSISM